MFAYICAFVFPIIDGLKANRPVAGIAPSIEDRTIFACWVITLFNTNLIYLRLEGTLSANLVFQDSKLLTIRRIAIDVWYKVKWIG